MKNSSKRFASLVQASFIVAIVAAVAVIVLPINFEFARVATDNAPYVMLTLLAGGLVSLVAKQPKIMTSCFLGAAALAFVLRSSTNTTEPVIEPSIEERQAYSTLEVAQLSTANLAFESPFGLEELRKSPADIVNIQGLTPNWAAFIADSLSDVYPYQYVFEDMGLQGNGLLSRTPLGSVDSVMISGVLHIEACVLGEGSDSDLRLLAVQTLPPVNSAAFLSLRMQLNQIAERVANYDTPSIVLGDFNSVPWSAEISDFQEKSSLLDSRRSVQSTFVQGAPQLFEVPVEHIFFSKELDCLKYRTLRSRNGYLGNGATFTAKVANSNLASI